MFGWRARIGVLVPPGNPTVEPEFYMMVPDGVTVHCARLQGFQSLRVYLIRLSPSEAANHQMDHYHVDDGFTRFWQELIVFTQPAVTVEPPQRALDNPPLGDHFKPFSGIGALGDFQTDLAPRAQRPDPVDQGPSIGTIGPDAAQPRTLMPEDCQHLLGPIAVLHAGGRDDDGQDQSERVDEDMPFAAFDLFVGVEAADPPFSVVLTDWLSMTPALDWRRLPAATRTSPRSRSCMMYQVPSLRHCQK
jgi:hypothetical protein